MYGLDNYHFSTRLELLRVLQTSISLFTKFIFLALCISPSIQTKSHIFWKRQGYFLEGDIQILKFVKWKLPEEGEASLCSFEN